MTAIDDLSAWPAEVTTATLASALADEGGEFRPLTLGRRKSQPFAGRIPASTRTQKGNGSEAPRLAQPRISDTRIGHQRLLHVTSSRLLGSPEDGLRCPPLHAKAKDVLLGSHSPRGRTNLLYSSSPGMTAEQAATFHASQVRAHAANRRRLSSSRISDVERFSGHRHVNMHPWMATRIRRDIQHDHPAISSPQPSSIISRTSQSRPRSQLGGARSAGTLLFASAKSGIGAEMPDEPPRSQRRKSISDPGPDNEASPRSCYRIGERDTRNFLPESESTEPFDASGLGQCGSLVYSAGEHQVDLRTSPIHDLCKEENETSVGTGPGAIEPDDALSCHFPSPPPVASAERCQVNVQKDAPAVSIHEVDTAYPRSGISSGEVDNHGQCNAPDKIAPQPDEIERHFIRRIQLQPRTPKGSSSYAIAGDKEIDNDEYSVTQPNFTFLPRAGSPMTVLKAPRSPERPVSRERLIERQALTSSRARTPSMAGHASGRPETPQSSTDRQRREPPKMKPFSQFGGWAFGITPDRDFEMERNQAQRNCRFDMSSGLFTLADAKVVQFDSKAHRQAMVKIDAAELCSWYDDPSFIKAPWEEPVGTIQPCGSDEELEWEPQKQHPARRMYMYKDLIDVVPDPEEVDAMRAVQNSSDDDSSDSSSSDEDDESASSDCSSGGSRRAARQRSRKCAKKCRRSKQQARESSDEDSDSCTENDDVVTNVAAETISEGSASDDEEAGDSNDEDSASEDEEDDED